MAAVVTAAAERNNHLHLLNGDSVEEETTSSAVDGEDEEEEEEDSNPPNQRLSSGQSPRYEAFVMTGEKILRLNPKISPNYAKLKQSELPKHTEILETETTPVYRGPFADLENNRQSKPIKIVKGGKMYHHNRQQQHESILRALNNDCKMPASQSENVLAQNGNATRIGDANGSIVASTAKQDHRDDRLKEGSVVTVHGTFRTSETDTIRGSDRTLLQSGAHRYVGGELPSPVSPVFLSEPVSPAKYAFGGNNGGRKVSDEQRDVLAAKFHRNRDENGRVNDDITLLIHVSTTSSGDLPIKNGFRVNNSTPASSSPSCSLTSTPVKNSNANNKMKQFDSSRVTTANNRPSTTTVSAKDYDAEASKRLAKRLYTLDGFSKSDVAKHLAKNNEFGALVAGEYLKLFNFAGLRIDAALRKFLFNFCLTGETSERERILSFFARRYYECNPSLFSSEGEVHTLACALLLLNTDLHGQNVTKRMTSREFVENISQTGFSYSRDLLKSLYESIKSTPIEWARDFTDSETTDSGLPSQSQTLDDRFVSVPDPDSQVEYKKGWVMRKCIVDNDGKKMPFGRRSWREFYATIKGMILYLHKDEMGFKKGSFRTFHNAIRLHHALAVKANDYTKKQHVFRVHTATLAEYLFQASDPTEMQQWIDSINFVAACFSAPPLPAPISARQSFHRPFLPSLPTKLSMSDQLHDHESRITDIQKQLAQHRREAPSRSAKPRVLQTYAEKEVFLIFELQRYSTYGQLLRSRLEEFIEPPSELHLADDSLGDEDDFNGLTPMPAQSGQSDRLSYRAAINCAMTPSTTSCAYETTF